MFVDGDGQAIPMDHVPPLAEQLGRQRAEEGPLFVVQVEVRAGDFGRTLTDPYLVPELENNGPITFSHFT